MVSIRPTTKTRPPAPLFDSGNSLWYNKTPQQVERIDWTFQRGPFDPNPAHQLALANDLSWFDPAALSGFVDEAAAILSNSKHATASGRLDHIARGLQKDPEFRARWTAQETQREVMASIVEARTAQGLSQKELADRCGMKAANLCRLENGNCNPSVSTLAKIAHGLGKKLQITFV